MKRVIRDDSLTFVRDFVPAEFASAAYQETTKLEYFKPSRRLGNLGIRASKLRSWEVIQGTKVDELLARTIDEGIVFGGFHLYDDFDDAFTVIEPTARVEVFDVPVGTASLRPNKVSRLAIAALSGELFVGTEAETGAIDEVLLQPGYVAFVSEGATLNLTTNWSPATALVVSGCDIPGERRTPSPYYNVVDCRGKQVN